MGAGVLGSTVGRAFAPDSEMCSKQKSRSGMVSDTCRCVGCEACMVACRTENTTL